MVVAALGFAWGFAWERERGRRAWLRQLDRRTAELNREWDARHGRARSGS